MLEAKGRGYWKPSDDVIKKLQELFEEVEDEIEGVWIIWSFILSSFVFYSYFYFSSCIVSFSFFIIYLPFICLSIRKDNKKFRSEVKGSPTDNFYSMTRKDEKRRENIEQRKKKKERRKDDGVEKQRIQRITKSSLPFLVPSDLL